MKRKITPELSSKDWKEFCSRFHFDNDKLPLIRAIYTAMLPLVDAFAYYSIKQDLPGVSLAHYAYGLVTLGNGVDELSELYLNHEQLEEAYIADCLSLMLLSNAYEQFAKAVEEESSLYAIELSFLGDEYPLELLPEIFEHVSPDGIHLTGSNMLKRKNIKELCNTCANCKNLSCPSRKAPGPKLPHTYGAMQIFNIRH